MDKIAFRHPVKITTQLRYGHIMQIVQESYNDFRRDQKNGETIGTSCIQQLKITTKSWKKISGNHKNLIKQLPKRKRLIQNFLHDLL